MSEDRIEIFTDGACKGNPGPGGWGVYIRGLSQEIELFGRDDKTTNNRMELTAIIEGLRAINTDQRVVIHTDSRYALDGISVWIKNWKRNGWKTASKGVVKNTDLWQKLDELSVGREIEWVWVKGHSGNPGNEKADLLANKGISED